MTVVLLVDNQPLVGEAVPRMPLGRELADAAAYAHSLLPRPLRGGITHGLGQRRVIA